MTQTPLHNIFVFVLAMYIGIELIQRVPQTLHTPLMSGSNAISGITIVGALAIAGQPGGGWFVGVVAFVAIALATTNAVGGFMVTDRMLKMFSRKPKHR